MSARPSPPTAAFASSIFDSHKDEEEVNVTDLQVPLLKQNEIDNVEKDDVSPSSLYTRKAMYSATTVKAISLVSGSGIALFSQLVLWTSLWNDDVLRRPTSEVVLFSLAWSFWTCLIVFSMMSLVTRHLSRPVIKSITEALNGRDEEDEEVFQVEAHYIVGALLSISITWLINDLLQARNRIAEQAIQIHPVLTVVLAAAAYALFVRWIVARRDKIESFKDDLIVSDNIVTNQRRLDTLIPTFQMISATLGTIIGLCSQFILSMLLWRDNMTKPLVDSVICFSLIWSFVTVMITLVGCMSLRIMLASSTTFGHSLISITEQLQLNRIALRMEAAYVSSSLIGICSAWVIIDILTNMTDQILPNIFMLFMSLAAFRAIIFCIPEEQCMQREESTTVEFV